MGGEEARPRGGGGLRRAGDKKGAGRGWPPVRPRPGAASQRVPLAVAAAEAVAAVAAGRA